MQKRIDANDAPGMRGTGAASGMRSHLGGSTGRMSTRGGGAEQVPIEGLWERLSDEDLEAAGGTRGGLIRVITERLEVSKREAKRQVTDAARVVRSVEEGAATRGKRMRRTFERTGREIGAAVVRGVEGVADLVRVLSAGGLAGKGTKRLPRPKPEAPLAPRTGVTHTGVASRAEAAGERAEAS